MSNISKLYSKKFSANKTDTIVSFKNRLSAFLEKYPEIETRCRAYAEDWRIRNPQYEKFEDMYVDLPGLGENLMSISNAYVDDSMQRDMKFSFVTEKVVPNFDPHLVNSVRFTAFQEKDCIWDGQQTSTSIVLVAMFYFDMSLEEAIDRVKVPYVKYPSTEPAKLRTRFIRNNDGSISCPLTKADLAEQMIFAVRIDNSNDLFQQRIEEIYSVMEKNDMFFSDEHRSCVNQGGALSRLTEIWNDKKFATEDIIAVIKYHGLARPDKPVEPLEIDNLAHIFMFAREQGIEVNDEYIKQFAITLRLATNNTWSKKDRSKKSKHMGAMKAYKKWRSTKILESDENKYLIPARCNQTFFGPAYICAALKTKGFKFPLPKLKGNYRFNIDTTDFDFRVSVLSQ